MPTKILSPMPGKIIAISKKMGDMVQQNEELMKMEAMKMEMPIVATVAGAVLELPVEAGVAVGKDDVLAVVG